ncbi:MAG: RNA methyltransferase [Phycisphaerales bacterium]|nr:RNA methyltransferase [Phycisphaerales bacterium]
MNDCCAIESRDDPRIEVYLDVRDRDLRGREGVFMAESEMVVRRLLRTPDRLHSVLVSPTRREAMRDVLDKVQVPVYVASLDLMCEIAGFHIHRGVLAAGIRPEAAALAPEPFIDALPESGPCLILGASGITNVDNMGGLFRVAAAMGASGVLLDGACCDPLYRKAIRVSMGHVLSVPWAIAEDLPAALERLQARDMRIWAAESCVGGKSLAAAPPPARALVLMGSEGHGLDQVLLDLAHERVEIPMAPGVPSLNVVSAAAVMLWARQQGLDVACHEAPTV